MLQLRCPRRSAGRDPRHFPRLPVPHRSGRLLDSADGRRRVPRRDAVRTGAPAPRGDPLAAHRRGVRPGQPQPRTAPAARQGAVHADESHPGRLRDPGCPDDHAGHQRPPGPPGRRSGPGSAGADPGQSGTHSLVVTTGDVPSTTTTCPAQPRWSASSSTGCSPRTTCRGSQGSLATTFTRAPPTSGRWPRTWTSMPPPN